VPPIDLLDSVLLLQLGNEPIARALESIRQIFVKELLHVFKFQGVLTGLLEGKAVNVLVATKELFDHSPHFVSLRCLVGIDSGGLQILQKICMGSQVLKIQFHITHHPIELREVLVEL
jgi:hypothetical protein